MDQLALARLGDEDLIVQLQRACASARRFTARIIALLVQVEDRRIHLEHAFPSLFEFCVRRLQMSEGEAYRRITAARIAARFPSVIERIESGALNLTNLVALRDFVDDENFEELLEAVRGKSKMEVLEMLAARSPRPDAPSRLRKLPTVRTGASVNPVADVVEPIAESRYRLQCTLSRSGRDKMEYARDLMRHRNRRGDLDVVVESALDALIEQLEKEVLAATARERSAETDLATSAPPRAVRREVFERDGYRCTFKSKTGVRCSARTLLELDHANPRAKGGSHHPANLRVRCRAHNMHHAEKVFGRDAVRGAIARKRKAPTKSAKKSAA